MPTQNDDKEKTSDISALRIDRSTPARKTGVLGSRLLGLIALIALVQFVVRPVLSKISELMTPSVEVAKVSVRNPSTRASLTGIASNGYVVARTRAALSADAPGRLVEMNVVEGSVVREGDVVARLYYAEHAAALSRAEAGLELSIATLARSKINYTVSEAKVERAGSELRAAQAGREAAIATERLATAELERAQRLVEEGVERVQVRDRAEQDFAAASAERDRASAGVEAAMATVVEASGLVSAASVAVRESEARKKVAEAEVEAAMATLQKTYVRAPFDGVVIQKEAEVGEVVSPNSQGGRARGSVVTMVDLSTLEVQAEVPETSMSAVAVGGIAQVFLDAWPTETYEVRVDRIWPVADRQKATIEVRAAFLAPDDRLRPEMGLRIVFLGEGGEMKDNTSSSPLITVPESAAVERDGAQGVFLIKEERVSFRAVQFGEGPPGSLAVEKGLSGGESIVLRPMDDLSDGDIVHTP
jgi:RND family efflux transporter MFP subunit